MCSHVFAVRAEEGGRRGSKVLREGGIEIGSR